MTEGCNAGSGGQSSAPGRLFVVATPIGNLEDMPPRAVRVLKEVDVIAAEDTRHSKKLLTHFCVNAPLVSYHDHNEEKRTPELIQRLLDGEAVALITDAGTPCISDPGYRLVRAAHEHGVPVIPVPGPDALTAALSASGLPNVPWTFHGFFPKKPGDTRRLLEGLAKTGGTHVFFESPRRLLAALQAVHEHVPQSEVCVARELTKKFEEIARGRAETLLERFAGRALKGECVLLVHVPCRAADHTALTDEDLAGKVARLVAEEGMSRRDAVRQVAEAWGVPRNRVYAAAMEKR